MLAEINGPELAEFLYPTVTDTAEMFLNRLRPRLLPPDAAVTRFAPSPTGALHIGGIYTALISRTLAHQTGGVFILRIEDTDKAREVKDGTEDIVNTMEKFKMTPDEGVILYMNHIGAYGPYIQSQRLRMYRAFAKELVRRGCAYPCFCSTEELEKTRETQEAQKTKTGYYGEWAVHRDLSLDEIKKFLAAGKNFVLRFRSPTAERITDADGKISVAKISFDDLARGRLTFPVNENDAVLMKSDGFPTYHFAHAVDDHLMLVTHVIRADEWLSSVPLHLQLFAAFGWEPPKYAHISPIMKRDGANKRKLSKRKDPESAAAFYLQAGYPPEAVQDYLLNLANSGFEDWRRAHPDAPVTEFNLRLEKISPSGALFDSDKLDNISRTIISRLDVETVFDAALTWGSLYDRELYLHLGGDRPYARAVLNIERTGEKRRKDIAKWNELRHEIEYFYDDWFAELPAVELPAGGAELIKKVLETYNFTDEKEVWLTKMRAVADSAGVKLADVAATVRVALTKRNQTPDLFELMQAMGDARVRERLTAATFYEKIGT